MRALAEQALAAGRYAEAGQLYESVADLEGGDAAVAPLARARRGVFAASAGMVEVGDFFIDRYEWPNQKGQGPRTHVDWPAAVDACSAVGKHLCSEAEWQRACTGAEARAYPYGVLYEPRTCVDARPAGAGPRRAGELARCVTSSGVADLSGNVAEWTSTPLSAGAPQRVVRGGWWGSNREHAACTAREYFMPGQGGASFIGFRCCL